MYSDTLAFTVSTFNAGCFEGCKMKKYIHIQYYSLCIKNGEIFDL